MVAKPTVNLNGASRESLTLDYRTAISALQAALGAVASTSPHPRDFQTAPAGEYEKARAEHHTRIAALGKIVDDLTEIALSLIEF